MLRPGGGTFGQGLQNALEKLQGTLKAHQAACEEAMVYIEEARQQLEEERQELSMQRASMEEEQANEEQDMLAMNNEESEVHTSYLKPQPKLGGASGSNGAAVAGARDRSRSRDRGGGASDEERLRQEVQRLGLDETASRMIEEFPPEEGLRLLAQVGDSVRNTSAFVVSMCTRKQSQPASDGLEGAINDLGLDESAVRALRDLPMDQALNIIDQVNPDVRNPSAFIMSIVRKGKGGGKGGGPSLEDRIANRSAQLNLDDTAVRMLHELPVEQAWGILDTINDDVRNPSALVTAEVRKIGGSGGKGRHEGGGGGGGGKSGKSGSKGQNQSIGNKIESLASQMDLDLSCVDALNDIDPEDAVGILTKLMGDLNSIRNRSAFVFAEVKRLRGGPPERGRRESRDAPRRGPVNTVPCKFFAEGRCKNGADCRFSHA